VEEVCKEVSQVMPDLPTRQNLQKVTSISSLFRIDTTTRLKSFVSSHTSTTQCSAAKHFEIFQNTCWGRTPQLIALFEIMSKAVTGDLLFT